MKACLLCGRISGSGEADSVPIRTIRVHHTDALLPIGPGQKDSRFPLCVSRVNPLAGDCAEITKRSFFGFRSGRSGILPALR